jgi:hypothetical protein
MQYFVVTRDATIQEISQITHYPDKSYATAEFMEALGRYTMEKRRENNIVIEQFPDKRRLEVWEEEKTKMRLEVYIEEALDGVRSR